MKQKAWHEMTDKERNAPGAFSAFIERDIEQGVGMVIDLDQPVFTFKGDAKWLYISFFAITGNGTDVECGWAPGATTPKGKINAASDRNHCIGLVAPEGREWEQLSSSIGGTIKGVITAAQNKELLRKAETFVNAIMIASRKKKD